MRLIVIALIALAGVVAFTALAPQSDPTPVIDHTARVVYIEPTIEEDQRPLMRAYVVSEDWCGPCKRLKKDIRETLEPKGWTFEPGGMIDTVTVDGARLIFPKQEFPKSIPFVIVTADGEPVECLSGVIDKGDTRVPTASELGTLLNEFATKHGGRWR